MARGLANPSGARGLYLPVGSTGGDSPEEAIVQHGTVLE